MVTTSDNVNLKTIRAFTAGFYPTITQSRHPFNPQLFANAGQVGYTRKTSPTSQFITVKGVNAMGSIGKQKIDLSANWKLAGNTVWYQHSTDRRDAARTLEHKYFPMDNVIASKGMGDSLKSFLTNPDEGLQQMGRSMMKGLIEEPPEQGEQIFAEKEIFLSIMRAYQRRSSAYSQNFLKAMLQEYSDVSAKYMQKHLNIDSLKKRDIPLTKGSLMPEEQAKAAEKYFEGDSSVHDSDSVPIGRTKPIDVYYNIGGAITPIDVTQELITSSKKHHGLIAHGTPEGRRFNKEMKEALKTEDKGEMKNLIYNYFQNRIAEYNTSIVAIKKAAASLYGTNKLTPEMMRNPLKSTQYYWQHTKEGKQRLPAQLPRRMNNLPAFSPQDTSKWQQMMRDTALRDMSASVKAVYAKILKPLNKAYSNLAAAKFTMHALGTWHQHSGTFRNAFTISHDPHITASILFQMYRILPRKYEFKNLRKKDVLIHDGYASLALLRENQQLTDANYVKAVEDQKAAQLGQRLIKGVNDITTNTIVSSPARFGKLAQANMSVFMPDPVAMQEYFAHAFHYLKTGDMKMTSGELAGGHMRHFNRNFQEKFNQGARNAEGQSFQDELNRLQQEAIDEERAFWPREVNFWASPYFGVAEQT